MTTSGSHGPFVPIGLHATGTRTERDSMGAVQVPADRYWGAQTERARAHFSVTGEHMPVEIIHALGLVKAAAARTNAALGTLDPTIAELIVVGAGDVASGALDDHFPLPVFQTGSGTQTNMNVNEVVANRAIQLAGGRLGSRDPVHPNDHVNRSQSSNDVFPTAVHVAAVLLVRDHLLPALDLLHAALADRSRRWAGVVKIGRTHLQDAVPMTVGQEWSGYAAHVDAGRSAVIAALAPVHELAIGGTAVGTGLNAPPDFGERVSADLAALTGEPFTPAPNRFAALAGADALAGLSGALRQTGAGLFKVANDLRWLGSGPRTGLGELRLPANEPGSSIMPGKVNPTQAEALLMICTQVLGNDAVVGMAASQGNLELNVMRPVIGANVLRSIRILGAGVRNFTTHMVDGVELDTRRIGEHVERSLMLVTALAPELGYDQAAGLAHTAHAEGRSLRDVAVASGLITADRFDEVVDPARMTGEDR